MPDDSAGKAFEKSVLAIARALWSHASLGSSVILEGQERDGVFITEECVHLLEMTTERALSKARDDMKKLSRLAETYRRSHPDRGIKCWFITKDEPTGDQQTESLQYKGLVNAISYTRFQAKLIDVRSYLNCRDNYKFGSSDETLADAMSSSRIHIDLELSSLDRKSSQSVRALANALQMGSRAVVLGDYGAGKSTTLLEVYKQLRSEYHNGRSLKFPVYLNLRDHNGSEDASDIFFKHAKKIGFSHPDHLVRAWRSGYCILLIDGFDEVTSIGIQGKWKLLRRSRHFALAAVRELVQQQPISTGIVIVGRAHYFDSDEERHEALNCKNFHEFVLNDFTDEQVSNYLKRCNLDGEIPSWFPRRPFLVATLARRGVLVGRDSAGKIERDPGKGWNSVLNELSTREAKIDPKLDGPTVRRILERTSSIARSTDNGLGPISQSDLVNVFKDVCGYEPDEQGQQLLVRLPGLGVFRAGEESRIFIDEDFADACRSGDVVRFITSPWSSDAWGGIPLRAMGDVGLNVLDVLVSEDIAHGIVNEAIQRAPAAITLDIARFGLRREMQITVPHVIRDVVCNLVQLTSAGSLGSNLYLQDCYFQKVQFDGFPSGQGELRLQSCYIAELFGPTSSADVPADVLSTDSVVERWGNQFSSNAGAIQAIRDTRVGVLITMLRKLFFQSGSGRQEDALFRGLNAEEQRYVHPIIKILERNNFISTYKRRGSSVWQPNRSLTSRVSQIVQSPSICEDELISAVQKI